MHFSKCFLQLQTQIRKNYTQGGFLLKDINERTEQRNVYLNIFDEMRGISSCYWCYPQVRNDRVPGGRSFPVQSTCLRQNWAPGQWDRSNRTELRTLTYKNSMFIVKFNNNLKKRTSHHGFAFIIKQPTQTCVFSHRATPDNFGRLSRVQCMSESSFI